jgi:hypothetical protein
MDWVDKFAKQEDVASELTFAAKVMAALKNYFTNAKPADASSTDKFICYTFLNNKLTAGEQETLIQARRILEFKEAPRNGFEQRAEELIEKLADLTLQARQDKKPDTSN